ncbi:hypothetical protein EDB89DRAFT_1640384 [Lactarius sanguifluus]|nr:hypothetical protein EDB89DRAFT_1640384 [Lactarius sanguifluus]
MLPCFSFVPPQEHEASQRDRHQRKAAVWPKMDAPVTSKQKLQLCWQLTSPWTNGRIDGGVYLIKSQTLSPWALYPFHAFALAFLMPPEPTFSRSHLSAFRSSLMGTTTVVSRKTRPLPHQVASLAPPSCCHKQRHATRSQSESSPRTASSKDDGARPTRRTKTMPGTRETGNSWIGRREAVDTCVRYRTSFVQCTLIDVGAYRTAMTVQRTDAGGSHLKPQMHAIQG